jgi:hypothetical protein
MTSYLSISYLMHLAYAYTTITSRVHFQFNIYYFLALVLLSSITKKGEIVRKIDPSPFD